ncbi:MAG TPA: right-handed parallel beta-helix repeat-containing protein, partial [Candidatus Hydrogenedentes bacterium]|nr:right-handed parallel beta-helix repeat-containing protein [Candidatus Hydrogenedentota bacterium]
MRMNARILLWGLLLAGMLPVEAQTVVYVDAYAPGANTGDSWLHAYTNLQDALADSSDEIWVAQGVYRPAPAAGARTASFALQSGRRLYGGFAGGETHIEDRNVALYPTVLSGDLNYDDGDPEYGPWADMSDNSYHVVTAVDVDETAVLDGFIITRGWSWESSGYNSAGAGIYINGGGPTIVNCTFQENLAHSGAAMVSLNAVPTTANCTFQDNLAEDGRGGAIYFKSDSVITLAITGSTFRRNTATTAAGPGDAGAIWADFNCVLDLYDCLFEENTARWRFATGS